MHMIPTRLFEHLEKSTISFARPSRSGCGAAAVLAFLAAGTPALEAASVAMGPAEPLKIVSFDLSLAPGLSESRPKAPEKPSWRTSFGSEIRQTEKWTVPDLGIDADVVLLQGLTSMREARRLFPAREWKLIVSRQLIGRDDPPDPWARDASRVQPVTAVAVRFQPGVKVTGQDHLDVSATETADGRTASSGPAATAVRLNVDGRRVWMVSAALPETCATLTSHCDAMRRVQEWRERRRSEDGPTLVGGRLGTVPASSGGCTVQSILSDSLGPSLAPPQSETSDTPVAGCVATLHLPRDVPEFMTDR